MIISSPYTQHNPRLTAVRWIVGTGLCVLLFALFRVQVLSSDRYISRLAEQSLRRIRIPAARGEIVDRHGVVLASNRPSYDIALYLEQLITDPKHQNVVTLATRSLRALSRAMGLPVKLTAEDISNQYSLRRPLPLPVWRDVNAAAVAAFVERASTLPGADLIVTPVREYPQGTLAAHVLGFTSKAQSFDQEAELERYYYYQPDNVGRQGVELACDDFLSGEPGGKTIMVSPGGTKVRELGDKRAVRGHRVVLTLDARIQRVVENAMASAAQPSGRAQCGAAVVLDVRTGEVLAMASLPTFDPNVFSPGTPPEVIRTLWSDPNKPTLNRAYGGAYAPGSTFKPVTLLAALESGAVTMDRVVDCRGSLQIGRDARPFGCWLRSGHGPLNAWGAIRQSCDVWFYTAGLACGVDTIDRWASAFGFGEPTGLDIGREYAGLLPSPAWKWRDRRERWWDGDTAQLAIGQSFLLVTPIQMAVMAAALANGGNVLRPFVIKRIEEPTGELVQETPPLIRRRVPASTAHFEDVRRAMLGAVQAEDGTAHRAFVPGFNVAGKTGTAEYDLHVGGTVRRINRAWFIGFAPFDHPQLAVAVVFEDAASGGHTAAPVAGKIFAGIYGKQIGTITGGGGD